MKAESKPAVYVTMANTLNRATHNLSVVERRILMLAISKLENRKYTGNPSIRVTALELAEHAGITPEAAYISAITADKQLYNRSIPLLHDLVTGEPKKGRTRWVTTSYYGAGEGYIELSINNELLPYLTELKREFTRYNHARTGGFKSIYSCRLFDLLMQQKSTGKLLIKIDDLADALEVPKSLRANFANMRNRAIEPAIREIKEKDGLVIKWEPLKKKGRKILSLKFTFPKEQQTTLQLKEPKKSSRPKINNAYIEQYARPGESYEQARIRLQEEIKKAA